MPVVPATWIAMLLRRLPRSRCCGLRFVNPSADPALIRGRRLPFCWPVEAAAIKTTLSAATQRLKALQALLSGHIAAHLGMPGSIRRGNAVPRTRPVPTRQNSQFWMSATSRTVIVRGVPNGRDDRTRRERLLVTVCNLTPVSG